MMRFSMFQSKPGGGGLTSAKVLASIDSDEFSWGAARGSRGPPAM